MSKLYICKKCGIINGEVMRLVTTHGVVTNKPICAKMYQDKFTYTFYKCNECNGEIVLLPVEEDTLTIVNLDDI